MNTYRTLAVVLIMLLAAVAGGTAGVAAQEGPGEPANFYGDAVDEDGDGAPAGTTIVAVVDGEVEGEITVETAGQYGEQDPFGEKLSLDSGAGDTVSFHIDSPSGPEAVESPKDLESGTSKLDLTFPSGTFGDDETDDDDDTTAGGGGGGGGGTAPVSDDDETDESDDTDDTDEAEDTIEATRETVDQSEPDIDIERTIEDSDPETPGVTVDTSDEASTVESITFADEETTGSVSVREYSDQSVVDSTSNSLSAQLDQDVRSVGTVADITVSDNAGEPAADTAATVRMGIDADDVENPDNLVINHETDDGWEQLDTTVEEVTDDRVRVSADVDGFSLFAVAEVAPAEDGGQLTRSRPAEPTEDSDGGLGTIGLVVVLVLVVVAAVAYRQMNSGGGDSGL